MSSKSIMIAVFALVSSMAATTGGASAHGKHFHRFHHNHGFVLRIGPSHNDCSFYREMWHDTGLFKWKRRYYECKGWW